MPRGGSGYGRRGFSDGGGGLGGLSSPCSLTGVSGLHTVVQPVLRSGGVLSYSAPLAVWWGVLKVGVYSVSSGEGGPSGLSSPCSLRGFSRLHAVVQQVLKGGGVPAYRAPPAVW